MTISAAGSMLGYRRETSRASSAVRPLLETRKTIEQPVDDPVRKIHTLAHQRAAMCSLPPLLRVKRTPIKPFTCPVIG